MAPRDRTERRACDWLCRMHGLSPHDATALLWIAQEAALRSEWLPVDRVHSSWDSSLLWLLHRGMIATEDSVGVLGVSLTDKGRDAIHDARRRARRVAA